MGAGVRTVRLAAAVVAGATAVLGAQTLVARSRDYLPAASAPPPDTEVPGPDGDRAPLRMIVAGDSTAAGVGASGGATTVGGRLARVAVGAARAPVRLHSVAVSGARTRDLQRQASRALMLRPHLVLVLIGANDATHLTSRRHIRAGSERAVSRLTSAGAEVVVGTCPDVGAATALPRPLRDLAGWRSRAVADTQRAAVTAAGGTPVDLARTTGPAFRAAPRTMLSEDGFHPSDEGYRVWAQVLAGPVRQAARRAAQSSSRT